MAVIPSVVLGSDTVRYMRGHVPSQLALTAYGMEDYLLSPRPRDSLIDANKEGLCTCAGEYSCVL